MKKMFNWSQYQASLTWKIHVQNGIDFLQKNQGNIYLIKYEELVLKTESEFRKIFEFLELDYEPKTTDFLQKRPPINVAPGTASESSIEKLDESRINWSFIDKIIYNHVCKDTEFALNSINT
jgi:hypothetical protein